MADQENTQSQQNQQGYTSDERVPDIDKRSDSGTSNYTRQGNAGDVGTDQYTNSGTTNPTDTNVYPDVGTGADTGTDINNSGSAVDSAGIAVNASEASRGFGAGQYPNPATGLGKGIGVSSPGAEPEEYTNTGSGKDMSTSGDYNAQSDQG
jgi:hypothetical protein